MSVKISDLKAKQAAVLAAAKSAAPFPDAKGSDPVFVDDVAPGAKEIVSTALGGKEGTLSTVEAVLDRAVDAIEKADRSVTVGGVGRRALRAIGGGGRGDGVVDGQELAKASTGEPRIDAVAAQLLRFQGVQGAAAKAPPPPFVGTLQLKGVDTYDENVASVSLDVRADGTAKAVVSTGGMIGGPRTLEGRVKDGVATFEGGEHFEKISLKVSLGERKVASLDVREMDEERTYHFNLTV